MKYFINLKKKINLFFLFFSLYFFLNFPRTQGFWALTPTIPIFHTSKPKLVSNWAWALGSITPLQSMSSNILKFVRKIKMKMTHTYLGEENEMIFFF